MPRWGIMWRQFTYCLLIIALVILPLLSHTSTEIERHSLNSIEANLKHQAQLAGDLLKITYLLKKQRKSMNLPRE